MSTLRPGLAAALILFLGVSGACARQNQTASPEVPAATPITADGAAVVLPDGAAIAVELAIDDETRAQGLMYRESLASDRGMLFLFTNDDVYPFWMKNTLIPLDMVWIDRNQTIAGIRSDVPPCRRDPCPSYDPQVQARYVLELAAGVAAKHRLAPGQKVRFRNVDRYPAR